MTPPTTDLTPLQRDVWSRAISQIEAMRSAERTFAQRVKQDLIQHPGYYAAARERTDELLRQHNERPHWRWAWERWKALLTAGSLSDVIDLLDDPEANQEMLSSAPFTVMRPPLPENDFYRSHAAS